MQFYRQCIQPIDPNDRDLFSALDKLAHVWCVIHQEAQLVNWLLSTSQKWQYLERLTEHALRIEFRREGSARLRCRLALRADTRGWGARLFASGGGPAESGTAI